METGSHNRNGSKSTAESARESTAESAAEPGKGAPPFDPRQFRSALGRFASGVTVVTARYEDQTHGMTANAFVSVSLDPPLVLVSLDNRSYMHRILPKLGHYGVSVLAEDQERLSNHFAGRTSEGMPHSLPHPQRHPLARRCGGVFRRPGDGRASGRRPHALHRSGGAL